MSMDDEVEDPSEFLENEKENDPVNVAKEQMKLQREGIELLRSIREKEEARGVPSIIGSYRTMPSPPLPKVLVLNVRKIKNGYILVRGSGDEYAPPGHNLEEAYFKTVPELLQATSDQVALFAALFEARPGGDPTPAAPAGA